MITRFQHKGLRKFYETTSMPGIVATHETKLQMILAALDATEELDEWMNWICRPFRCIY